MESKDVRRLSDSQQLRRQAEVSRQSQQKAQIIVNKDTKVSKPYGSAWMSSDAKTRPATEVDVQNRTAVFSIPGNRSKAYDLGVPLPAQAKLAKDIDAGEETPSLRAGTVVTIVQAEIVDDKDVLIGFHMEGSDYVCSLEEIELSP